MVVVEEARAQGNLNPCTAEETSGWTRPAKWTRCSPSPGTASKILEDFKGVLTDELNPDVPAKSGPPMKIHLRKDIDVKPLRVQTACQMQLHPKKPSERLMEKLCCNKRKVDQRLTQGDRLPAGHRLRLAEPVRRVSGPSVWQPKGLDMQASAWEESLWPVQLPPQLFSSGGGHDILSLENITAPDRLLLLLPNARGTEPVLRQI